MRIAMMAVLAMLASACGPSEQEKPACCAIEPKHQCRADLTQGGMTPEELAIVLGPDRLVCPSEALTAERIAELEPVWAKSSACRTMGDIGKLSALRTGQCETMGVDDLEAFMLPPGVSETDAADCAAGLVARGLKDNEIWLMMQPPEGLCPNNGVSEERLRQIIADDWAPAGCVYFTNAEMLKAMDTGACGGDAG